MKPAIIAFLLLVFFVGSPTAQTTPANPQTQPTLITGATAHLGNGQIIENSIIAFEDGKITAIGDAGTPIDNSKNWKTIDATGKSVYPGLIAPNTQLGLIEIGAVRATRDSRELGEYNPNVRSIIAYNTDSEVTPTVRSNGILIAQTVPQGGVISGLSSIVELDAWNWEDAAYKTDDGVHLDWPGTMKWEGSWLEGNMRRVKNDKFDEAIQTIKQFFDQAKAYHQKSKPDPVNLKFEAMGRLFDKKSKLFVHVDDAQAITSVIPFKKQYDIDMVLVSAQGSYRVAGLLAKNEIPVILHNTQSLPQHVDDDIDQPFKTPKALSDAGVLFAIAGDGFWQQRNLPFYGGQAVAFGLPYNEAIQAMTGNTAKILGIDETVGTLETGKDATLIISKGDVLDMRTSVIEQAFIRGKAIDLDNKQKQLYRKFEQKYGR